MIIYWLFFSLPILLSINNIRFYNQKRFNFLLLYSFFCVLFIGFRYEVGGDWGNYIALAEQQLIGLDPIAHPPGKETFATPYFDKRDPKTRTPALIVLRRW